MAIERVLAGHRVLRLLAAGDRSQVWLAAGDVVLKVLTPPPVAGRPGREAEALHRAAGDHVIELLDISLGPDHEVLVFPRLPRGSLAELLTRRATLDAGEAVTILAPLAATVARLHAAGVAHTDLSARCVLFRQDGAPMLTGFGGAELFSPGLAEIDLERVAGVAADRDTLRGIADAVLARTTGSRAKVAAQLRTQLQTMPAASLTELLAGELFELAAARPVSFDEEAVGREPGLPRAIPVGEPATPELPGVDEAGRQVPAWADRLLASGPGTVLRDMLRERWTGLSTGRRRAVLAAAAAVLVLVVAMTVVPPPPAPELAGSAGTAPTDPLPSEPGPATAPAADAAILGDDPIAALRELIALRERCFRDVSVLCLEDVDQAGSSALDADRQALRGVVDGGVIPAVVHVSSPTLVERLGDSALIELGSDSDPASVLLLKGEVGWRIRDYLAAPAAGESE